MSIKKQADCRDVETMQAVQCELNTLLYQVSSTQPHELPDTFEHSEEVQLSGPDSLALKAA
jgi:hypothetical protein